MKNVDPKWYMPTEYNFKMIYICILRKTKIQLRGKRSLTLWATKLCQALTLYIRLWYFRIRKSWVWALPLPLLAEWPREIYLISVIFSSIILFFKFWILNISWMPCPKVTSVNKTSTILPAPPHLVYSVVE